MLQIASDGGLPDHAFTGGWISTSVAKNELDADINYAYLLARALPENHPALQPTSSGGSQIRSIEVACSDMWLGALPPTVAVLRSTVRDATVCECCVAN